MALFCDKNVLDIWRKENAEIMSSDAFEDTLAYHRFEDKLINMFFKLCGVKCDEILFTSDLRAVNRHLVDGIIWHDDTDPKALWWYRQRGVPTLFYSQDIDICDKWIEQHAYKKARMATRFDANGYEVTTRGDKRFSPFCINYRGQMLENHYQLNIKGLGKLGFTSWKDVKGMRPLVINLVDRNFDRWNAQEDNESIYIFTDNLNRTSGSNRIQDYSWYSRKYGKGKCYPTMSQAVVRGLPNAFPITTMYDEHKRQLTNNDLARMQKVWHQEVNDILDAYRTGKYKRIVISNHPIGNGKYSRLATQQKLLFDALNTELQRLGVYNSVDKIETDYPARDMRDELEKCYIEWFRENPNMLVELISMTNRKRTLTDRFWSSGISQAEILARIINKTIEQ